MELLHNRATLEDVTVGDWIDDCDDCWDHLLAPEASEVKVALKCSGGRMVIQVPDLAYIVQRETIDEFVESVGLGVIREMWVTDMDAPVGRSKRGA
jgi:hypothetical protein